MIDGKEVGQFITETAELNPQLLAKLAAELEHFKELSLKKKRRFLRFKRKNNKTYTDDELSEIFALCDAFIARISELIKKKYDQTKDGLNVSFDEHDQLILNGININAIVEQSAMSPNPKSMLFIKGVRRRLEHVLENKSNNRNFDRIREVVDKLIFEIDVVLKKNG